jgi:hypothetical protein
MIRAADSTIEATAICPVRSKRLHAYALITELIEGGLIERVAKGVYRAVKPTKAKRKTRPPHAAAADKVGGEQSRTCVKFTRQSQAA